MRHTLISIASATCLAIAASGAQADPGMMHHDGGYADHMFKQMDVNNDGAISKKEFNTFHEKRFKEMDANHDGKVTREEMDAAMDKMRDQMRSQMREHFKQRFDETDANHDGALSKDEAQKMPMVSQHFDEIDANHDGKVTQDEIQAYMPRMHGQDGMQGDCPMDGKGRDDCMHGDGMHHHGGMMK